MPFFKAIDGRPGATRDALAVEPAFAPEAAAVGAFLASPDPDAPFPPPLLALRRAATLRNWAEGLSAWNASAGRQLAVLRQHGGEARGARLLQRLFAADFGDARREGGLDASGAVFAGDLLLDGADLSGPLRLDGARMLASADLSGARVARELTAEQAEFVGPLRAANLAVGRALRFSASTFLSDVVLDGAVVGREFWLRGAAVAGSFSMRDAQLRGDASLGACRYGGPAALDGTRFDDTVSFEGAAFAGPLSLDRCAFAGRVWLTGVAPAGGISVEGARFAGDIVPPLHEVVAIRSPQRELMERLRRG